MRPHVQKKRKKSEYLIDRLSRRELPENFAESVLDLEMEVEQRPSQKAIKRLTELYVTGVEYYSAIGDMRFKSFTERMHRLYENPAVNAALQNNKTTKVSAASTHGISTPPRKSSTRPNRFEQQPSNADTTATTTHLQQEKTLKLETQVSITSFQGGEGGMMDESFTQAEPAAGEGGESPRFMMQDAFVDYVSKRDNLKLDLDQQESQFHRRLLKRRMTSTHRSCNRAAKSKPSTPKRLKSVTSFTNLFFGKTPYKHSPQRSKDMTPILSQSMVEESPQNISLNIKDITFMTEAPDKLVQELDETGFSLLEGESSLQGHPKDLSWMTSDIEKESPVHDPLSQIKEDIPTLQILITPESDRKQQQQKPKERRTFHVRPTKTSAFRTPQARQSERVSRQK